VAVAPYHEKYLESLGAPTKQLILRNTPPPPPMGIACVMQSLHARALAACCNSSHPAAAPSNRLLQQQPAESFGGTSWSSLIRNCSCTHACAAADAAGSCIAGPSRVLRYCSRSVPMHSRGTKAA
jgi:hypothetical protein